jgi:hypothetical protein
VCDVADALSIVGHGAERRECTFRMTCGIGASADAHWGTVKAVSGCCGGLRPNEPAPRASLGRVDQGTSVRRRHGISSWSVQGSRGTVPRIGTPEDAARGEVRREQVLRGVGMSVAPAESGNGRSHEEDTAIRMQRVPKREIDLAFFSVGGIQ